jgi:hypothetical protein
MVGACLTAKIATAEVVHIDASLIRANVSWDSLAEQRVKDVLSENQTNGRAPEGQDGPVGTTGLFDRGGGPDDDAHCSRRPSKH